MRRRLDLAASLIVAPPVLFLDEPTTGLDPRGRLAMWDVIRELVADGTTVLLTTQYLEEADQLGIDRALYLPQDWAADPARRAAAGVPADVTFQTKPRLASAMLARALDRGVPAAWVTADEVYGDNAGFRSALEARGQAYVVAVKRTHTVSTWPPYDPPGQTRACDLIAALPVQGWQR